jgi:PAS domain S-box-containing protein
MKKLQAIKSFISVFERSRDQIVSQWIDYDEVRIILSRHQIEQKLFISTYANNIFDYFIGVINGFVSIGDCPVMTELLEYLKGKNITSQELFMICSHFKRSMVDISYDQGINSKEIFDEISYVFDQNFTGVLKQYSQTIYEKDIEINKNVELLQQYIDALNQSALVSKTDEKGVITHINDKFVKLCGYDKTELIGFTHSVIRHPDMSKSFFQKMWHTIQRGQIYRGTLKNRQKDGGYFYIDTTIVPIQDPFTEQKEYIAIGYEVTKLIDARQKALEADKAKDYFLSNMSHEIRTPLNAILGFVTLLQDEILSSKHKHYLDIIHDSGENLLSLINDILDFSKLRSGEFTIEPKVFNIEEILSRVIELFIASANKKKIALISYIDVSMPSKISSDPLRIQQIVSNFISNAIKFTPDGGAVEIKAKVTDDNILQVFVKDSGIGISESEKDLIFEPFSQIKYHKLTNQGTGLGLSICKQLAELLHGTIKLVSAQDSGSTFSLEIPITVVEKDPIYVNCELLKDLKIAFLMTQKTDQNRSEMFKNYYQQIGICLHIIDDVFDLDYDLLYFMDDDVDDLMRYQIINKNKPAIAIVEFLSDAYESVVNVTKLTFPIYLTKLRDSALEALDLKEVYEIRQNKSISESIKFDAHILVAEDNEANQELIKLILDKYCITYDVVSHGADALKMFKQKKYNLVLMDDQMPVKNGFDTTKEILAFEQKFNITHTPVVALTANLVNNSKKMSMLWICDEFLGKPIIMDELEKVFNKYLDKQRDVVDISIFKNELELDDDQLQRLLEVYINKMDSTIDLIKGAILAVDYEEIAKLAHSMKGSSANFRMYKIQNCAGDLESEAQNHNDRFDYDTKLTELITEYQKIKTPYLNCYSK